MEEKKLGIELIKKTIKFLYDLTIEGMEAFKDKKLSLPEILGFGDNIYSGVVLGMKYEQIFDEIENIDSDEVKELIDYVGKLIQGATSEEIGSIVENAITFIYMQLDAYEYHVAPIIEIIKKKKQDQV